MSTADKTLGLGLGYTRPRTAWRTGYDQPGQTSGLSFSLLHDLTSAESELGVVAFYNIGQVRNGVFLNAMLCQADTLRGVVFAAYVTGQRLAGVFIGPLAVGGKLGHSAATCQQLSGLAVSHVQVQAETLNGLAVAGYVHTRRQRGVAVALLNRCQQLHGLQLGLLNYAGNNPRGLRWLPPANLHL